MSENGFRPSVPIYLSTLALLLVIAGFIYNITTSPKIVYVDSTRLIDNYEGMKAARGAFQQKSMQWQANIDTLGAEYQRAVSEYEKSKNTLSRKEKELSEELIKTKRKQLSEYQQAIQQQSAQEDMKLTQQVLAEVNNLINEYAKDKDYDLVLGASGGGNIVYADEYMDITEEVLELLNDKYVGR